MTTTDLNISVEQLSTWLHEHKPVTIIDVRPLIQRREWSIPESDHLDVYDQLNTNTPDLFNDLHYSKNSPIVTVCAAGRVSLIAAEQLRKKGYEAYSLSGGMKAWNFAWNTAELKFDNDVTVIQIRRLAKGCLSYLVGSENEAVVIDASLDPEVYLTLAKEKQWQIKSVMDTHIHADYISRTKNLAQAANATHLLLKNAKVDFNFTPVEDNHQIKFGKANITVMHTPGHTWESVSYLLNDTAIITGDTLFTDGVGRPDLKASHDEALEKAKSLYSSLQKILSLPGDLKILPAHISHSVPFNNEPIASTIDVVKNKIPLLQLTSDQFVEATLSKIPPTPPNYQTIAGLNRSGSYEGYLPADLEVGANRCAVS